MARLSFRCDEELVARVDVARGREPREAWLRRTVEQASGVRLSEPAAMPAGNDDPAGPSLAPAPAEQPERSYAGFPIRTDERMPRGRVAVSSAQSKRDVRPIPKRGER